MEESLVVQALAVKELRIAILSFLQAKEVDPAACTCRLLKVYCFSFTRDGLPFDHPESPFYISDEDYLQD